MRIKNSIKNGIIGTAAQILITFVSFGNRSVFIYILGSQFLGLNGLFSNILSIFSLSELGIGTAIVFNMYRAVAEKDQYKINSLMTFYSKVYKIIAIFIVFSGAVLSFFIQYFIKDNPFSIGYLRGIFLIFVINNAISYLFSYRSCIIYVNQKEYKTKIVQFCVSIATALVQIFILVVYKDYILYLLTQTISILVNNLATYYMAKKLYPEVICNRKYKLDKIILEDIIRKVKALILHNISSVITFGTDNIVISTFVGIAEVGLYSNYSLIINTLNGLIFQLLNGVNASLGNLVAVSETEKVYQVFKKLNFAFFWIYSIAFTSLVVLLNPFISLWIGSENLFEIGLVMIVSINFYITGVRQAVMFIRNAAGFYTHDKKVAIIKPTINLIASLLLVQTFGVIGVFIGTLISSIVTDVILYPLYLFKNLFEKSSKEYMVQYVKYTLITFLNTVIVYYLCFVINWTNNEYLLFVLKIIVCVTIPNFVILCLFWKSEEFKYFLNIVKNISSL